VKTTSLVLAALLAFATSDDSQDADDARQLEEISRIRAIDNHMHGDAVDPARRARWNDDNPLGKARYPEVVGLQRTNPEWRAAWFALYGYAYTDAELPHVKELLASKRDTIAKAGANWPSAVLDTAGVDIALLNTVQPGAGQLNGRFRWGPYADPLLRPFAGDASWLGYSGGELPLSKLLRETGFSRPPPTLIEYRVNIVQATLARWKKNGAVAIKFLCAYARPLDFAVVEEAAASPIYAKALKNEPLTAAEQKLLEDYLFNAIAIAAGAQQLVVQIHTGNGDGPYFNNSHANPALPEDAINSRPPRKTHYLLPPSLPPDVMARCEQHALASYRAIGCSGHARPDLRITTGGGVFVLEVNTLPGMTATSLLPKIAKRAGMDYATLCEEILATSA
jgi:hypothetical protein